LPACETDDDCPPAPQGPASCAFGRCATPCSGPLSPSEAFCQNGAVRSCYSDPGAPCDQCPGICDADEYCGPEVKCVSKLGGAEPCTTSDECQGGVCDGSGVCQLPLNTPCKDGDPCQCVSGFCTQVCNGTFQDYRGGCPDGFGCSDGYHPLPDPDVYTQHAYCLRECQTDATLCGEGQECRVPPDYFSSSPIRLCLWP
jgi:hypothetical protein